MPRRTNPVGESHRTANIHAPHRQWDDPGTWLWATPDQPARVVFRDLVVSEPVRDDRWRWAHLDHVGGPVCHLTIRLWENAPVGASCGLSRR